MAMTITSAPQAPVRSSSEQYPMKKYKTLLGIGLAMLPVAVAAETYDCTTTSFDRGGWVTQRYIVEFDAQAGSATAYDAAIKVVHEAPIPVSYERRSETSHIFRWQLTNLPSANIGGAKISYRFTLFADRGRFTLSGRLHGYDNQISGSGTCARVK